MFWRQINGVKLLVKSFAGKKRIFYFKDILPIPNGDSLFQIYALLKEEIKVKIPSTKNVTGPNGQIESGLTLDPERKWK